jgi:anti-anti-sigma factor
MMPINDWSESIVIAELSDEPALSDDLDGLIQRLEQNAGDDPPDVIIDAQNVTHLNSSNIAQLLRLRKILTQRGARMRLCGVHDHVWSVLMVTGLDKVFEFTEDVMTSLASLQIEADR